MNNMIFEKCPTCGEFAFVQPDQGDHGNKVFKCSNGHVFKKKSNQKEDGKDQEVWEHMPEWARLLRNLGGRFQN